MSEELKTSIPPLEVTAPIDPYEAIKQARETTLRLRGLNGLSKEEDEQQRDDTYRELYANAPASALLWEGRKLVNAAPNKSQRDAVLINLIEAYAYIDPAEAYQLLPEVKNEQAEIEALAKFGGISLDDSAVKKARDLASTFNDLALVGTYGHDAESLRLAYKKVDDDIEQYLILAGAGYRPALRAAKIMIIEKARLYGSEGAEETALVTSIEARMDSGELFELSSPKDDPVPLKEDEELEAIWREYRAANQANVIGAMSDDPIKPGPRVYGDIVLDSAFYHKPPHWTYDYEGEKLRKKIPMIYKERFIKFRGVLDRYAEGGVELVLSEIRSKRDKTRSEYGYDESINEIRPLVLSEVIKDKALELYKKQNHVEPETTVA